MYNSTYFKPPFNNQSIHEIFLLHLIEFYVSVSLLYSLCPLLGMIANIFVIILCFKRKIVKESYKYFVLNLALADFFLSACHCCQLVHNFLLYNETACIVNGFLWESQVFG